VVDHVNVFTAETDKPYRVFTVRLGADCAEVSKDYPSPALYPIT